jgi:hypothetical protein
MRALAVLDAIQRAGGLEVRVGILQTDGEVRREDGITQAELAAVLEYGVPKEDGEGWRIPPRPAHQDAAREHGRSWQARMGDAVDEVLGDAWAGRQERMPPSLRVLAVASRADVRRRIPYWSVGNADATVEAKRSSSPLIDTTDLVNSIRAQATDGKKTTIAG